ncbi:hypothetical protein TWF281_011287 [Arthrobotrys megalospora]
MSPTTLSAAFLTKLRTYPSLPSQTWYYITLVAVSICNKPELIAPVLSHAFTHSAIPGSTDAAYVKEERAWLARNPGKLGKVDEEGRESALRILRRCREGLVKSGAIGGIPKAINALYHLRKCHDPPPARLPPRLPFLLLPPPPLITIPNHPPQFPPPQASSTPIIQTHLQPQHQQPLHYHLQSPQIPHYHSYPVVPTSLTPYTVPKFPKRCSQTSKSRLRIYKSLRRGYTL